VKHREPFRPYGVSILAERTAEFFDLDVASPFMLLVAAARPAQAARIPSALHVNGTSRLQTVTRERNGLYYELIREFDRLTGIPMVINTSFNDRDEPLVCTPEDGYRCFTRTQVDDLVLGPYVVEKPAAAEGGAR
jgi:carbamoyltransferase